MKQEQQKKIECIAKRIGWRGDTALLQQALTHPTFFEGLKTAKPQDNQRLEYLGDAVLDLIIGEELYHLYPQWREGQLSKVRASLVCEASLAAAARKLDLSDYLLLGHGAQKSGDAARDSLLSDAIEAIIGAIYIKNGLNAAKKFVFGALSESLNDLREGKSLLEDYKGLLQNWSQNKGETAISYKLLNASGPDHARHFQMGVFYGKKCLAMGEGNNKKEAQQAAAAAAWHKIKADQDNMQPQSITEMDSENGQD